MEVETAACGAPGERRRDSPRSCARRRCEAGGGGGSRRRGDGLDRGSVRARVCVCVHACGASACIDGSRGNLCSAQRRSGLPEQAGSNPGGSHSQGETHAHTSHAHTHTHRNVLHIALPKYGSGKEILAWIAVCWRKEGRKTTHSSENFLLIQDPGAPSP